LEEEFWWGIEDGIDEDQELLESIKAFEDLDARANDSPVDFLVLWRQVIEVLDDLDQIKLRFIWGDEFLLSVIARCGSREFAARVFRWHQARSTRRSK
jgi:hypothetical protein